MLNTIFVATAEPTTIETIKTALSNGFTSTAGDIMSVLALVIPIALGVWGAFIAIKFSKKSFQTVSK